MWNLCKNKVSILEFRLGHPFTSTNSLTINPLASTGYFTELLHLHHLIWKSFAIKSYSLQCHQTCDFDIPIKTSLIFPLKVPFYRWNSHLFPICSHDCPIVYRGFPSQGQHLRVSVRSKSTTNSLSAAVDSWRDTRAGLWKTQKNVHQMHLNRHKLNP